MAPTEVILNRQRPISNKFLRTCMLKRENVSRSTNLLSNPEEIFLDSGVNIRFEILLSPKPISALLNYEKDETETRLNCRAFWKHVNELTRFKYLCLSGLTIVWPFNHDQISEESRPEQPLS